MAGAAIPISPEVVRRLAVTKQRLAGRLPARATREDILSVIKDLAYVQWDPVSIVAPSHVLALWNRVGDFRLLDLEKLLWDERKLFEHWTPQASIVLMEDYPLYASLMKRYPSSLSGSWRSHEVQARKFLAGRAGLHKRMLSELKKGPLQVSQFRDYQTKKRPDEWTPTSDVSHMLFHMLMLGEVMVVGHDGNQNVWGLTGRFLPSWVHREPLPEVEFEREAAQRAIRALGTATPSEINYYFVRGRYRNLKGTLARLEADSLIHLVNVERFGGRDARYIHDEDLPLLEPLRAEALEPRVSLLPPFDNLVCSQARTKRVFDFDYVREQFLPQEKRRFGTYVLPILWGERLIGRIDPWLDKQNSKLVINSVHAESGAPTEGGVASKIGEKIQGLAEFLGAREVAYSERVPAPWKSSLH